MCEAKYEQVTLACESKIIICTKLWSKISKEMKSDIYIYICRSFKKQIKWMKFYEIEFYPMLKCADVNKMGDW